MTDDASQGVIDATPQHMAQGELVFALMSRVAAQLPLARARKMRPIRFELGSIPLTFNFDPRRRPMMAKGPCEDAVLTVRCHPRVIFALFAKSPPPPETLVRDFSYSGDLGALQEFAQAFEKAQNLISVRCGKTRTP